MARCGVYVALAAAAAGASPVLRAGGGAAPPPASSRRNSTSGPTPYPSCPHHGDVFVDPKRQNENLDACEVDSDCPYERLCAADIRCNDDCDQFDPDDDVTCMCLHKTLFPNFSSRDLGSMLCIFFGCMLAASAGIGGGGLFVPIYMLISGFLIQEAIPLSHATVMGNSVAQLFVNLPLRHEHKFITTELKKPMIDYSVPLLLLPGQLGGNNLGVLFTTVFPADLLIILSELLLAFATIRVFEKGYKMWKAESLAAQELEDDEEQYGDGRHSPAPCNRSRRSSLTSKTSQTVTLSIGAAYVGLPKEDQVLREEQDLDGSITKGAQQYWDSLVPGEDDDRIADFRRAELAEATIPFRFIALMFAFWCIFAGAYVGLHEMEKCSGDYWALMVGLYPVLIAVTVAGGYLVRAQIAERNANHVQAPPSEVVWTTQKLVAGPIAAVGVGFVAGLLGLGGGELMAPLLLELGLLPKAASATSAYMIIWTTSSNMVHYGVGGDLATGYAVCFCCLGFLGGGAGRFLAMKYTSRGRQSPIALMLGTVLAISMILLAYRVGTSNPSDPWWPFKSMC